MNSPGDAAAWRGATCVVTGGAGFIGSNVCAVLCDAGAQVRVIDSLEPDHGGDLRNLRDLDVEFVGADIGSPDVADAVAGADLIFDIAGQVSHTASMRDPLRDLELNTMSHARFLETVRRVAPGARLVHTSTRQVYGRPERLPVDETHHAQPVDVNGVSKWAGEQLHLVYHRAHGLATTCLRLTNVYGPRQRLTSDELGVLPVFFRRALTDQEILLFGDGSQTRDLLHVDDVVRALFAATAPTAIGEIFNVGHHRRHTLADVADAIVAAAGGRRRPVRVPWPDAHRVVDVGSFHTDGTKMTQRLGWTAHVELDDGVRSTVEFYREYPWYLSST
ncbi:MAG: NAD-dependent epimerase/dehydratase family protein [Ilumatobacteraceae bacterium]